MYKLTVVAGPSRGQSFPVQEGETSIGRQAGNAVVLTSAKVSKRHCVLVVDNGGQVMLSDQGSSNGTFVNGVLAKSKPINPGDRISVGEYVLELTRRPEAAARGAPAAAGLGNVLQFPVPAGRTGGTAGLGVGGFPGMPNSVPGAGGVAGLNSATGAIAASANLPPKDLKGKIVWAFEHHIMPFFYTLNLKHEWRIICLCAMAAFTVGNLILSVYPLIEQNRTALINEMGKRASFMAKQIAERNSGALAARAETKTEIGSIDSAEGVRVALLTDLDSRILAPGTKLNQYLTSGAEAALAIKAKKLFQEGRETGVVAECDADTVCAVEPVRIVSQQAGRNVTVGMAVVSIDSSLATPDIGEMAMTYSETLIATGLLGGLILLILYRVTLKPLRQLNEDMDQVLKGDLSQVTHEFKFEELNALWDLINSALQRVPRGGVTGALGGGGPTSEELAGPFRMMGAVAQFPVLVCDGDKKVMFMNSLFEDVSGIRLDNSMGQDIGSVARDQSFVQFVNDIFDRAMPGTEGVSEDYDFSGVSYKVKAASVGSGSNKVYVLAASRVEG
jgi:hypothetical protein